MSVADSCTNEGRPYGKNLTQQGFIKFTDLEVDRKYKVHDLTLIDGVIHNKAREFGRVQIDIGFLTLPERYDRTVQRLHLEKALNVEDLYIVYRGQDTFYGYPTLYHINFLADNISLNLARTLNAVGSYSHIKLSELQVNQKYKVYQVKKYKSSFKKSGESGTNRIGVRIDLEDGYLLLPELFDQYLEHLQSRDTENLYIVLKPKGRYNDIKFYQGNSLCYLSKV